MTGWNGFRFLLRLGRLHELPSLWASALTAALISAWYYPGWAVIMGSSHAWYARHHYFNPALGIAIVSLGCGFLRSNSEYRRYFLQRGLVKSENLLVIGGYGFAASGILIAANKGLGAALFCAAYVLIATARMQLRKFQFLDALLGALCVLLIYLTIIYKYRLPTLDYFWSDSFVRGREIALFGFLGSVSVFQFACFSLPRARGWNQWITLFFVFQPVWVVPLLVVHEWQWHAAFLIPMVIFFSWVFGLIWSLRKEDRDTEIWLENGRPLVDFLVLGSLGFALLFHSGNEATLFNSYTLRTLLLWCPGCFLAGWILKKLSWRSLIS